MPAKRHASAKQANVKPVGKKARPTLATQRVKVSKRPSSRKAVPPSSQNVPLVAPHVTAPTAPKPRRANLHDLAAIEKLEVACFQDYRRASEASLRRSLASPTQSVWVVDGKGPPGAHLVGLLVLWHFRHRVRVYDIATDPDARGQGIGAMLLAHAESLARSSGCPWMTLEAEEADQRLVAWYQKHGYTVVDHLVDFYHGGCHAVRMTKRLG